MTEQSAFPGLLLGSSNRFAHAAALAVANQPGSIYNPLWFYGPSGTGKTTLLRAMLQKMQEQHPGLCIRSIQTEEYVQKLISSIQAGTQAEFRAWLSEPDVLALDHAEFLQGKNITQITLAKDLARLANRGCQIILVSVCSAQELEDLHRILRGCCEWFLTADILLPDDGERLSMIRQTALDLDLRLPEPLVLRIVRSTHTHCHTRFILNQLATRQRLLGPDAGTLSEILDTLLERKAIV